METPDLIAPSHWMEKGEPKLARGRAGRRAQSPGSFLGLVLSLLPAKGHGLGVLSLSCPSQPRDSSWGRLDGTGQRLGGRGEARGRRH